MLSIIISWVDCVLYTVIRTKHSTEEQCLKLQENNYLEYIPQCKSWLLQMHLDGQFTHKHIYGWRKKRQKIYNNRKEYMKQSLLVFWLASSHCCMTYERVCEEIIHKSYIKRYHRCKQPTVNRGVSFFMSSKETSTPITPRISWFWQDSKMLEYVWHIYNAK